MEIRKGRERRYDFDVPRGFRSPEVGRLSSALDEMRERVYDQVGHLSQEALDYVAPGTTLSIGRLLLHLGWAEANWMRRLAGPEAAPSEVWGALTAGALDRFAEPPARVGPVEELVSLCGRVREEMTIPFLAGVSDPDEARAGGATVRGVAMQLTWHWIYHSGQIGLLSLEAGHDYEWTMRAPLCGRPVSPVSRAT